MPKTLLLADDSVVIQKLVGLSFANEDVELVTTDNGDDALDRARELRPDLILADVVMPGKNGYEVCQAIKSDPQLSTTPVLLLTGTFEAFDEDRARQVGSDGHITKPFEAQGLVDRVTDLLSRPRPAPAAAPAAAPNPPAPAAAKAAAAPAAPAADDAYDFFDDDVQELAAPEPATTPADVTDSAFEFGAELDPLESTRPGDEAELGTDFELDDDAPDDLTIAVPGEAGVPAAPVDAHAADATRVHMGETMITDGLDAAPPRVPVTSLDGQLPRPQVAAPPPVPPAAPAQTAAADPAQTMLADDLFADPVPTAATPVPPPIPQAPRPAAAPAPGPPAEAPAMDSGFEFSFEEPAAAPAPPPAPAATPPRARPVAGMGEDITAPRPEPAAAAELPDARLEVDDPLAGMGAALGLGGLAEPGSDAPAAVDAADSTFSGYDVSASDLGDPLASARPGGSPSNAGSPSTKSTGSTPELSPVLRGQIHETLEKVAWEAFADLSDTIVKQVIQRVESVVWEVVPQMAEALIQEEIRRMKGED